MTDVAPRQYRIDDRYTATDPMTVMLTGVQALARLPVEQLRADRNAGRNTGAFVSGYPGSPLGGFDSAVARAARLNPDLDIVCTPGTNEELGASAVMGSQLASTSVMHDSLFCSAFPDLPEDPPPPPAVVLLPLGLVLPE